MCVPPSPLLPLLECCSPTHRRTHARAQPLACITYHVSFFKPLKTFYGIGSRRSLRGITSARRVYSGGDGGAGRNHDHDHAMRSRPAFTNVGWGDERKPDTWGVLQMLRNSTLQPLLVNFCEQSLCGESVDFLVDVAIHYESMSNPEEQFETLKDIVDNYLAEGAENEVNVSSAQRSAAAKWLTRKDEFFALEAEARAHILDGQRDEIAKVRVVGSSVPVRAESLLTHMPV